MVLEVRQLSFLKLIMPGSFWLLSILDKYACVILHLSAQFMLPVTFLYPELFYTIS